MSTSISNQTAVERVVDLESELAALKERMADLIEEHAEEIESKNADILHQVSACESWRQSYLDQLEKHKELRAELEEQQSEHGRELWEAYATQVSTGLDVLIILGEVTQTDDVKETAQYQRWVMMRTIDELRALPECAAFDIELKKRVYDAILYLYTGHPSAIDRLNDAWGDTPRQSAEQVPF